MIKDIDISQVTGKPELVRMLAKLRLRSDPAAHAKGITEDVVDGFSEAEVNALPESAIVHIADAYFILEKKGLPDDEIFRRIDLQRSLLKESAAVPADMNLSRYIKWRLNTEFPHLASLEEMIVDMEILYVVKWFSRGSKRQQWADADAFAAKAISTMRGKYQESQAMPVFEEPVAEVAKSRRKWPVVVLLLAAVAGMATYWLFFMGGLALLKP